MPGLPAQIAAYPTRRYEPGEIVLAQGSTTGKLFFLVSGAVEIVKNDLRIASSREPGAVFGEMSVFLNAPHAATVRVTEPSVFHVVDAAREALHADAGLCFQVCETTARRLGILIDYLVNVRQQYEGHDHLGMVNGVLETLLSHQPRVRIRPSESTLRHGQELD